MSKVNGYECDVCNKIYSHKKALNHYTRKYIWKDWLGETRNNIYSFDICQDCLERIVKAIKLDSGVKQMKKYNNYLCPGDLKHFLLSIIKIKDECRDDSYVTDKIANKRTLGGKKIRYDEDFYLAVGDGCGYEQFSNYKIPRELQKRIVCLIEQYIDEVKAGGIDE